MLLSMNAINFETFLGMIRIMTETRMIRVTGKKKMQLKIFIRNKNAG